MMGLELTLEERMNDYLRRVTDLFIEGTVLELPEGLQLWIQKLNSFQIEEARRDGVAARTLRMIELSSEGNSEFKGQRFEIESVDADELRRRRVGQLGDELYLQVVNDIEADPDWVERLSVMKRMPELLSDEGAADDDPRRAQLQEINIAYITAIREGLAKAEENALADLEDFSVRDLREAYYEAWRQRVTLDVFMDERRITELYYATRMCQGVRTADGWDHAKCDHDQRLLNERSQVRTLPDALTTKIVDTLESITVPSRESGNSDAPASSSASSEPSSVPAETSAPSSPEGTPVAAPTT